MSIVRWYVVARTQSHRDFYCKTFLLMFVRLRFFSGFFFLRDPDRCGPLVLEDVPHLTFLRQLADLLHVTFVGHDDERLRRQRGDGRQNGGVRTHRSNGEFRSRRAGAAAALTLLEKSGLMLLKSSSCSCSV